MISNILTSLGLIGIVLASLLIIYSIFRRDGLTFRYVILAVISILVFGGGLELKNGLLGFYEFIGTAGFVLSVMFAWLILHSLFQKKGKAFKYFIFAILSIVLMFIGFELAEQLEKEAIGGAGYHRL